MSKRRKRFAQSGTCCSGVRFSEASSRNLRALSNARHVAACSAWGERGLQRLAGAKHGAKSSLARTLLSLTVFYFCSTAWIWALDPEHRISQYAHTAWRVRDGAFAGAPSSITQTTDGYVWIGTLAGLVRFDGVRFVPFAPPAAQHLPNPAVFSLLGATDG